MRSVSRKVNDPVNKRTARHLLKSPLHLVRSESDQKEEAKPRICQPRECSQRRAAMRGDEVACLPSNAGWPLGRDCGRASSLQAKSALSASLKVPPVTCSASDKETFPVRPAIMQGTWNIHSTDEVPRRPSPFRWVNPGYKSYTKDRGYASEAGGVSPQPRPKGCQQSQSRGDPVMGHQFLERQNRNVFVGSLWPMSLVSNVIKAPKWPEGTSSLQLANRLRNGPLNPRSTRRTVLQS